MTRRTGTVFGPRPILTSTLACGDLRDSRPVAVGDVAALTHARAVSAFGSLGVRQSRRSAVSAFGSFGVRQSRRSAVSAFGSLGLRQFRRSAPLWPLLRGSR